MGSAGLLDTQQVLLLEAAKPADGEAEDSPEAARASKRPRLEPALPGLGEDEDEEVVRNAFFQHYVSIRVPVVGQVPGVSQAALPACISCLVVLHPCLYVCRSPSSTGLMCGRQRQRWRQGPARQNTGCRCWTACRAWVWCAAWPWARPPLMPRRSGWPPRSAARLFWSRLWAQDARARWPCCGSQ